MRGRYAGPYLRDFREDAMRHRSYLLVVLALALVAPGCKDSGIIAEGGDFSLSVEQLRFEITKLGPSSGYNDTYDDRYSVVMNLAARNYLADEAEERGFGGETLALVMADAERNALAEEYRRWKIDNAVMLPRIKTKPWLGKLDRRLHLKDLSFLVYPVAEEALRDLRNGAPVSSLEEDAAGRPDIHVTDMGWIIWKDIQREIANIVFRLDAGEATNIVSRGDGYHIFYLVEDEPFGLAIELLSARSKRFVAGMEKENLEREVRRELADKYHVRFLDRGLADGLKAFAVAFAGERPPDSLMAGVIARYPGGDITVGQAFTRFVALRDAERPYIGDYHGLSEFALELMLPQLEAMAGRELGLGRSRDVRFAVRTAREEALIPAIEDVFKSQVEVTEPEIEAYYKERGQDLFEPSRYHAARIVVSSWETARQAQREIMMGADFGDVARTLSEDERSAPQGGDLGWLSEGLVAVYDSVLTGMEPGDVSRPFETLSGVEILKLLERQDRRYFSFEEARPDIRIFITNTKANEMLADFVSAKREQVGFFINEDLLRRVWLPGPQYKAGMAQEGEPAGEDEEEGLSPLPKID
jgi:hypothetical protein